MDNQLESRIRSRITLEQKTDAPVVSSIEDRITQRLKDQQEAERAAIQRSLTLSIDKDPNQLAQVNRIAKESGIDRETVEANAAMFLQRQKERGILSASERSPALSKNYADPNFAGLAKDDADNLSSISDYVGAFTSYMMGARRGGGLPQDLAAIYYGTKQSSESLGRMALEPIGRAGRALGFEDNIFEKVAQDYANMAKATEEGYKKIAPLPDTFWERSVRSGVQSGAQMVKYIPLAFLGPPGWQTALTMMSTEAASNTYQQDREKGVDIGRSLNHAALDGIAEYTMERYLGFAGFAKNLLAGQSATKLLAYEIFREIPGEMGTTLWQNFNEWAIVNPQKSLSQFLAEQPEALAETAVATIFGGAIQTGAGRSSLKLIESIQGQQLEATEALQRAEALQQALQTAMNTKLAQLSPEDFTRVVNEMGENAPVRFDARLLADVFAQSGIETQELQQRLPSAFEQLQEGTIDNREVSIPVGEFISGVMNTPLQEQLQDYARLGDSEYSKAEAQEAMKNAGEFLANEADRVLKQAQDQQAWQESTDEVKSTILKQLNDAGTFKPDVNEWFATMQGAFFSTMAERTGVTPKEFYQEFSLKIQQAAQVEITGNTAEERLLDAIKKASQGFRSVEDATAAMIDFGHAVYRVIPGQAPVLITDAAQLQTIPLKELRMIDRSMLDEQGNVYAQSATLRRGTETLKKYGLKPGERYKTREVAAALEARQRAKYGMIDPYDNTAESLTKISNWMAEEVEFEMQNPEGSGIGWYSEKFQRALDTMGEQFPELLTDQDSRNLMTALIAITSDGQKVVPNFMQAMDIYGNFREGGETPGKFTATRGTSRQASVNTNLRVMQRLYDQMGPQAMHEYLMQEKTISELKQIAKASGGELKSAYQAHIKMPMAAIEFGPKLGAFYANLMGAHGYLTMDRWWSRTFNRYRGTLLKAPTREGLDRFKALIGKPEISDDEAISATVEYRDSYAARGFKDGSEIEKAANTIYKAAFENLQDSPFRATDRTFMLNAVNKAQQKLKRRGYDLSVADIQAILWYYEKRLYGELGARQTADISYEDAAQRVVTSYAAGQREIVIPDDQLEQEEDGGDLEDGISPGDQIYGQESVFRPGAGGVQRLRASNLQVTKTFGKPRENSTAVRGIHFSSQSRPSLSGRFYGTGLRGGESRRLEQSDDNRIKQRIHFYVDTGSGINPETGVGGNVHAVDLENVYDISADPLNLIDQAKDAVIDDSNSWFNMVESLALDAGFDGIYIPQAQGTQGVVVVLGDKAIEVDQLGTQAELLKGDGNEQRLQPAGDRARRYSSRGLAPLEGAPNVQGATGPDQNLVAVAEQYAQENGIDLARQAQYVEVDVDRASRIAAAYEAMQHNPQDPAVLEAYQNLLAQTRAQYDALVAAGYEFTFFDSATDPYEGNPWNAMRDLRNNKRMAVYGTYDGYGENPITEDDVANNPMLADTGLRWLDQNGVERMVTANDLFRAVHDAFGHGLEGAGFRARGEENAWQAHAKLFTGSALAALTTETRGQNSWLNFGPFGEQNQTAAVEDTVFAEQKIGLMPSWTWQEGIVEMPDQLFQRPSVAGVRGTFNPQKMLIELTQSADLSTFIHESGHFFLEVMVDLASRPNAPQNVIDDVGTVMAWFGMDMNTWKGLTVEQKRKHHEMFAESFERYMFDGKAPTPELQPMFRTFSSWLKRVYRAIKDIISGRGRQLPEEIRQVFDRMLATEEQIADAERLAGLMPNQEATDVAIEELQARSLKDLKWAANAQSKLIKKMQREATELRKGVENEVRERVALMPIYRAMRWIRTGEMVDLETGDTVKATQGYKLSTEAIEQMFPETMLARPDLTKLRGMTSKEGLHPDLVADMFGFVNGDILVRELIVATPQKEMVDGMTTEEMLNRYGDITSPEALKMAAMEAVHNEVRARALATELKAQEDALAGTTDTGRKNVRGRAITVNSLMQAAKLFADNVTSRTPARLLKREIQNHRRAELRASKEWAAATKKGETKKAIQAKRDQLLNHYTVKAMQDAQAEIQKAMAFFKTVNRGNNETLVKRGRDPDVVNAARAILAQYGLAPAQGKKADEYMELVKTNDPTMYASLKPAMDAAIADAKPIDQLTVQEIKALADEVGAFWHMSKRSRKMEVDGDLIDIQEAEEMLAARMDEIGVPASMPGETQALTKKDEAKRKLQFAGALLRRMEQWVEGMDGKYGGPFTKLIFEPVKKAADNYRQARVVARKQYAELVKGLQPVMEAKLISAPELNYTFGKSANSNGVGMAELLHAIIHTGNQSNKRKMLLGRGWATENDDGTLDTTKWDSFIDRIIREGTLKKEHYDFAQGVWDLLEGMKAGAQKTHREVFGRYFDEVTADAFVTPFGTYRGGYAPAQVDSRLVTDAAIRELAEAENESMAFSFPTTNRGFTKGRTEYNRPLLLDLRALNQHIDKVLLFTHMEPAVRDVNRLLRRSGINKPLSRLQPAAYDGMLIPWLNRAAKQQVETPVAGDGSLNRILSVARTRAGMSLMFANISNTFQQITGLSNAAVVVKASHLKRATAQYIKAPRELAESVAASSIFMNDRMKNEIAAINNSMEEILINPTTYQRAQTWSNRHAYFLQAAFDNVIGPIVWTGAYNQAIEEGMKDEQAVKFADSAVRKTQGSTLPEDISRIESGPAYARLFTQFVGYFNMIANTNGTALKNLVKDVGIKKGAGKAFYIVMMGVLLPAWIAEAIAIAFRGGPEDEDDDGYLDDWLSAVIGMGTLKFALAGIPFFGQAINAGINRFNGNPADDRIAASPAVSLIESAVAAPASVYKAIVDDGSAATAVRDVSTLLSVATGLPVRAAAKPIVYGVGVAEGRIEPEGPADVVRGLLTGVASPESRVQ